MEDIYLFTEEQRQFIRNRWVEALDSGKFLQLCGTMAAKVHRKDRFCALGVLGEISLTEWDRAAVQQSTGYSDGVNPGEAFESPVVELLWKQIYELAQVARVSPSLIESKNDGDRASFEQIAAYIRGLPPIAGAYEVVRRFVPSGRIVLSQMDVNWDPLEGSDLTSVKSVLR